MCPNYPNIYFSIQKVSNQNYLCVVFVPFVEPRQTALINQIFLRYNGGIFSKVSATTIEFSKFCKMKIINGFYALLKSIEKTGR